MINGTKKETCLVGVTIRFFTKGQTMLLADFDSWLWETEPDIEEVKKSSPDEPFNLWGNHHDFYFQKENCAFRFDIIGNSADDFVSPADWMIESIGIDELFFSWLPLIRKAAISYIPDQKSRTAEHITLVTMWEYEGYQEPDTPNGGGEYVEELEFVGILDLNKLKVIDTTQKV